MRLTVLLVTTLLFGATCFAQDKPASSPKYPPLAHQARILGTVVIEVRFKGCEIDPESPRVVSGHPMLSGAALEAVKRSTIRCGDFANSKATLSYEFAEYTPQGCDGGPQRVEVTGNSVWVRRAPLCWQP
jgi:hypothetical protein